MGLFARGTHAVNNTDVAHFEECIKMLTAEYSRHIEELEHNRDAILRENMKLVELHQQDLARIYHLEDVLISKLNGSAAVNNNIYEK